MSLYNSAKTRVRSAYSEEFVAKASVHQRFVLSPSLFAKVVDVITENARRDVVNELLYADDLVLVSKTMEDLKERFWNWRDALESKGLKVNPRKTKVMVNGSERELHIQKQGGQLPCGVCGRTVMDNSVLCTKCGNWQICNDN